MKSTPVQLSKTVTEKLEFELAVSSLITIVSDVICSSIRKSLSHVAHPLYIPINFTQDCLWCLPNCQTPELTRYCDTLQFRHSGAKGYEI